MISMSLSLRHGVDDLRKFLRAEADYRVEYGPFPPAPDMSDLKPGAIKNISGGGLLFNTREPLPVGDQIVIRIHLTGWRPEGDDWVETGDQTEHPLTTIAEVIRCESDPTSGAYQVGVKFLGRVR